MKDRITSAAILLVVTAVCVFLSPYTRVLYFAVAGLVSMYEDVQNYHENMSITCPAWVLYAYMVIQTFLVMFDAGTMAYIACFVIAAYTILFEGVRRRAVGALGSIWTLGVLVFPGLFFTLIMPIMTSEIWLATFLLACVATWVCDSFALFGGKLFGKHKIAPLVSPNKTVEGCICGAASSFITGIILFFVLSKFSPVPLWLCIFTALVSSTMGQIGDLAESLIKRYIGVKDFSNLIPGHGGIFDRADSLLWAIPTAYFCLSILL